MEGAPESISAPQDTPDPSQECLASEKSERLELLKLLQAERNWHTDLLVTTNLKVGVGSVALLVTGLLAGDKIQGIVAALSAGERSLLRIGGFVCFGGLLAGAFAMITHWVFRVDQAQACARAIDRLVTSDRQLTDLRGLFEPVPRLRFAEDGFGVLLALAQVLILVGVLCILLAIAL